MTKESQMLSGQFPNEPIFRHLLQNAEDVKHVIIHDPSTGRDADYVQLLGDVVGMQSTLRKLLPETMFDGDRHYLSKTNPFILVLSPGNYHFIVSALSILSLGGAFAPLDPQYLELAEKSRGYAASKGLDITILPIDIHAHPQECHSEIETRFEIDEALALEPHRPALILFTSGTSGPPKGVVHTRGLLYDMHLSNTKDEVFLSNAAIHWGSTIVTLMGSVLSGSRTEIIPQNAKVLWERLSKGGVTSLGLSPRVWADMKAYFENHLSHLPTEERSQYIQGAQALRYPYSRGFMPNPSLLRFWREEIGLRIHICYGITELGATVMKTVDDTNPELECCIGRPVPGITLKLSNGDHGEMLTKKPTVFSHYLNDAEKTAACFDSEGFYKTGDLARRNGDDYIIEGRASTDFLRFRGLKVPILQVEMHLLQLPFVSEGCIVSVPCVKTGERVAALVRLREPENPCCGNNDQLKSLDKPYLRGLRKELGPLLPAFMLPTALRILKNGEEIPRTASLKPIRGKAVEKYFSTTEKWELPSDVEVLSLKDGPENRAPKAWDWAGLRA